MVMAAVGRAVIACHARALKLRTHGYCFGSSGGSSSSTTPISRPVLTALLFAAAISAALFPRAVAFFLPLVASTSAFCATAYLSATSDPDRGAAKEVVLVLGAGEPAEVGTLQVWADADASFYGGGGVQVGCFLRKSATRGVDEDGEVAVLAGRILVPAFEEEELVSLQVDRLAEGVWDSYFGRWSTGNHYLHDDACDD
jgi:hypothetical protein